MRIHDLSFSHFRNLEQQLTTFNSRICIVEGKNGQGKTSLLEAIYLLAHGKSFREQSPRGLATWGLRQHQNEKNELVSGKFSTEGGEKRISFFLVGDRRQISINERAISAASDFYGQVTAVEFTPDDLFLIKGSPAERRTYIDRVLSQVDTVYIDSLVKYQRALRHRNSLLRKFSDGINSLSASQMAELGTWEYQLAEYGIIIAEKRKIFLAQLLPYLKRFHELVALYDAFEQLPGANEGIDLEYKSGCHSEQGIWDCEEFCNRLEEHRIRDLYSGSTTIGPHRDELDILLIGLGAKTPKHAKRIASQGQARTIALALKLAASAYIEEKHGEPPILLLDDVESELDPSRREALCHLLDSELKNQVVITTTQADEVIRSSLKGAEFKLVSKGLIN